MRRRSRSMAGALPPSPAAAIPPPATPRPPYTTTCLVDVLEAAVREAAQALDEETIYELKMRASESGGS